MKPKTGLVLTITSLILCGCPGMLICLGGFAVTSFGFMADKAQLKLDTNLDQDSVIWTGMGVGQSHLDFSSLICTKLQ